MYYTLPPQAKQVHQPSVEWKKAFDLLDKNKDGNITTSELGAAMKSIGLSPSEAELQDMIKSVDADASGTLDIKEFQTLVMRSLKMDELKEAFCKYDRDGDGSITNEEAREYFKNEGLPDSEIEKYVDHMFKTMDFDKDGKVNIEGE